MRYEPIDSQLFLSNRQRLQDRLGPDQYVILKASKGEIGSAVEYIPFRQERNFFWATGIDEPWATAVITKTSAALFIKQPKGVEYIWNSEGISVEKANKLSGIKDVQSLSKLRSYLKSLSGSEVKASELMPLLRMIKQPQEIDLIRRAIEITAEGNIRLLDHLRPGVREFELEAELSYVYTKRGAKHGFEPIVASGKNACTIHNMSNDGICNDGDMVIVDVGAEYANYSSDVSRTYPVNGKYSKRQRQIYESALVVQKRAIGWLKPGVLLRDNEKQVHEAIADELVALGVITESDIKKAKSKAYAAFPYFPHGTSHFLGLDVHDAGIYSEPLQAGMVITVEPGIYIPEEGIGVRIEDDVLITEAGAEVLSAAIPKDPDEIERILSSRS